MQQESLHKILRSIEREYNLIIGTSVRDGTEIIGYNAQEVFPAASIIKLALALCAHFHVLKKNIDPYQFITCHKDDVCVGSGILKNNSSKKYTIKNLVWHLLAYSDNTAQNMLERVLSAANIQSFITEELHLHNTHYVPLISSTHKNSSKTTPSDTYVLMEHITNLKQDSNIIAQSIISGLSFNTSQNFTELSINTHIQDLLIKHGVLRNVYNITITCIINNHPIAITLLMQNLNQKKNIDLQKISLEITKTILLK